MRTNPWNKYEQKDMKKRKEQEVLYYVFSNGQRSKSMIWSELRSQSFPPYALVWTSGMSGWKQLGQYIGNRRPAMSLRKKEVNESSVSRGLVVSLLQRMAAAMLDLMILLTMLYVFRVLFLMLYAPGSAEASITFLFRLKLQPPLIVLVTTFYLLAAWAYFVLFESSRLKATPGKLLFRLQVVSASCERVSLAQVTIRYWSKLLSILTLLLGFFMILWNPQRQSLHDMFSDTYVIKTDKWVV